MASSAAPSSAVQLVAGPDRLRRRLSAKVVKQTMQAVFALLPDSQAQYDLQQLVLRLHRTNPGLRWVQLPFHISLKQSFSTEEVEAVDGYFTKLAADLSPLTVRMGDPEVFQRITWLPVLEDGDLRQIHNRINAELPGVVADASAPFDGASYRFHLSLGFMKDGENRPQVPADLKLKSPTFALVSAIMNSAQR